MEIYENMSGKSFVLESNIKGIKGVGVKLTLAFSLTHKVPLRRYARLQYCTYLRPTDCIILLIPTSSCGVYSRWIWLVITTQAWTLIRYLAEYSLSQPAQTL